MTREAPPMSDWRGCVNTIIFDAPLRSTVDDPFVQRVVDALIEQWYFTKRVESYHAAIRAALGSGERISLGEQDEGATRDMLARVLHGLDARRPWPPHPFYQQDRSEWTTLRDAPVIARAPTTPLAIQRRLNRVFHAVDDVSVLILTVGDGITVALRSPKPTAPGVDVLAHGDPMAALAALREATGIDAKPL